jgi:CRISPR-associated endonuclease Csn1
MAKTLGLDLGTNSVGWAVVEKNRINNNEFKTTLKDKGVVIFSEGVKKEKGSEKSRAAERTNFRSARRIKFRRKLRKYKTLKVLINDGMCPLTIDELEKWRLYKNPETTKNESFKNYPTNSDFLDWLKTDEENNKNPYYFRDKFSRQKYDWENNKTLKEELGRAFYHIAQRRGFLSNRLEQSDDSVIEEYKEKIEEILEKVNNSAELLDNINQLFEPFEFEEKKEKDLDATEKKLNRTKKYILRVIENKIKDKNFSSFSEKKEAIHEYINKSENLSPVKGGIKTLSNEIEDANCITLGQYFYHLYKKDRNNQKNKIRTNYTAREEHYLHELEIICKTQELERIKKNEKSPDKKYFGLVKELYNAIFYQRPLKSQKGLVGNCSFEKNKPRCPVSHPLFEEFRMWSFINNIKIKTPDDDKLRVLTKEEKEKIIPKFYRKSKAHFDFEDLVKDLIPKGKKAEYYKSQDAKNVRYLINYNLNTTVSGCPTSANLKNIFGDDWKNILFNYKTVNKKEEIKNRNVNYHDLWNILSTFTTNDKLKDFALEKLKLNEKDAVKFSKISLKKDYASLSLAVIKKILPLTVVEPLIRKVSESKNVSGLVFI